MKIKQILVAGGAGFLGYHLCKRLLKEGHAIFCLDNFATGMRSAVALLQQSRTNGQIIFIDGDVIALPALKMEFDEIYNLACPAAPIAYQRDPIQTIRTAIIGTANLLELAKKINAHILQASTSEIYGDPTQHPQKETYWGNVNPIGIRACYDEGKRVAETYCKEYYRKYNTPVSIARIFNTYGPHMRPDDGRVISNFIVQALRGESLTIYGTGKQTRSFCFVDDLIDGLIKLMARGYAEPVNLGNSEEHTVAEIAEIIIGLTGSKSNIAYQPLPQDDPTRRCPDLTRAKKILRWQPEISLQDGLQKTIAYFQTLV